MDFDDLIMVTVNLLQAFPEVAATYRRKFRHVLVDEYQDTNHAQYVLIRELAGQAEQRFPWADRDDGAAGKRPRLGRTRRQCRQRNCAWSATPTSPSMPSAARRSGTSTSSSGTSPVPG